MSRHYRDRGPRPSSQMGRCANCGRATDGAVRQAGIRVLWCCSDCWETLPEWLANARPRPL